MRKRRTLVENTKIIFKDDTIKISTEGNEENEWFFEIGTELTTDITEAVSILMRDGDGDGQVWNIEIKGINTEEITPQKSLYWLTGGNKEWKSLDNYNRPWCDCYLEFQEEFGFVIVNSVKRAKTIGDIRDYFLRNLNLPVLYDFALSKKLLR